MNSTTRSARSNGVCSVQNDTAMALLEPAAENRPPAPQTFRYVRKRRGAICEAILGNHGREVLANLQFAPALSPPSPSLAPVGTPTKRRRRQAICSATADVDGLFLPVPMPSESSSTSSVSRENLAKATMDMDVTRYSTEELVAMCCEFYKLLGLKEEFGIDHADLHRFVVTVMYEYMIKRHNKEALRLETLKEPDPPPYHNFVHAVDVTQCVFTILKQTNAGELLDKRSQLVLLCAALCHDMGHGGRTNAFLSASGDPIVQQYRSCETPGGVRVGSLERLHADLTSKVLKDHFGCSGILQHLASENRQADGERDRSVQDGSDTSLEGKIRFVKEVKQAILSTDLAAHKSILEKFEGFCADGVYKSCASLKDAEVEAASNAPTSSEDCLQLHCPRILLLMMILKVSDISNVARNHFVSDKWSERLADEWAQQVDAERRRGLPASFNCEVNSPHSRAKSSLGFVDFVALKCFQSLAKALPETEYLIRRIEGNKDLWKETLAKDPNAQVRAHSVASTKAEHSHRRANSTV